MAYLSAKIHASSFCCREMPASAIKHYSPRQDEFIKASEESPYNKYTDGPNKKLGIIACGIGYNYLMENYPEGCEYPVLKIGQYPLPKKQLHQLIESCDEILVLEDGQPFVEKQLKGYLGIGIKSKRTPGRYSFARWRIKPRFGSPCSRKRE